VPRSTGCWPHTRDGCLRRGSVPVPCRSARIAIPLYICHRWDSNAAALIALLSLPGMIGNKRALLAVAGVFAAVAAWITPPLVLVVAAIAIWMALIGGEEVHRFYAAAS